MSTSNHRIRPPKPEPLTCQCGADGRVRWASPDKRWPNSRGRWMRSGTCATCHYEKYGEAKKAAQRKDTEHARKCLAAMQQRGQEQQAPTTLSIWKERLRGL